MRFNFRQSCTRRSVNERSGTRPVPSPLFLRIVPGHSGTASAYAVYTKALRALGAEAITTTDLS